MLRTSTYRLVGTIAILATLWVMPLGVHAAPITYTMRGVATGSVGATNFSGAHFAVKLTADTDTAGLIGPGVSCNDPTEVTFAIDGIASGAIATPVSVAENVAWQLVAIARGRCVESGPMWTNGRNPQFATDDLVHDLGPVPLDMASAPPGISVDTSGGLLVLGSVSELTFQAQLASAAPSTVDVTAAVPALSASGIGILTALLGLMGAIAARRRRAG